MHQAKVRQATHRLRSALNSATAFFVAAAIVVGALSHANSTWVRTAPGAEPAVHDLTHCDPYAPSQECRDVLPETFRHVPSALERANKRAVDDLGPVESPPLSLEPTLPRRRPALPPVRDLSADPAQALRRQSSIHANLSGVPSWSPTYAPAPTVSEVLERAPADWTPAQRILARFATNRYASALEARVSDQRRWHADVLRLEQQRRQAVLPALWERIEQQSITDHDRWQRDMDRFELAQKVDVAIPVLSIFGLLLAGVLLWSRRWTRALDLRVDLHTLRIGGSRIPLHDLESWTDAVLTLSDGTQIHLADYEVDPELREAAMWGSQRPRMPNPAAREAVQQLG